MDGSPHPVGILNVDRLAHPSSLLSTTMAPDGVSAISCEPALPPPSEDLAQSLVLDHIVYSMIIPAVCSVGCIAAFICVVVFTRPQMRSSLNIYLAGLSFFDLVLLAMSLLIYPPMSVCLRTRMDPSGVVCQFFWKTALVTFPISLAAQTASVWTCVAVTVDRYLAVRYPLKMRVWCTPTKAMLVLAVIATVSFLYKLPSVFELQLDECGRLVTTDLRQNSLYIVIYNTYGYLLLLIAVPWTIMIILNVIVVKAVHRAYRIRRTMTKAQGRVDDKERRCTVMALVMLSTFILFNFLAGVNNIIEAFFYEVHDQYRFRIPIGNLLVCINSASNILIYSIFGRKFRRVCIKLFCPCVSKKGYRWLQPTIGAQSDFETRKTSFPSSARCSFRMVHTRGSTTSSCGDQRKRCVESVLSAPPVSP